MTFYNEDKSPIKNTASYDALAKHQITKIGFQVMFCSAADDMFE